MPDPHPAELEPDDAPRPLLVLAAGAMIAILLSGSCMLFSAYSLFFAGHDAATAPGDAISVIRSGIPVASIGAGGVISLRGQPAGVVTGGCVYDHQAQVAAIDAGGVVTVKDQPAGRIEADGAVRWDGALRWRIAADGTITRADQDAVWGQAQGYQNTPENRRNLAAYLLFFAGD